jgi:peptidoglycan/xylan/chitin deacetylase (PgdA/CDA1 family)
MYHRIATVDDDPYGLAVHPDNFRRHLEHLQRLDCVVPLSEMVAPGGGTGVAITFDDGYLDNATTAAPLLQEAALPATFFITTGSLGGRHFWWDQLSSVVLGSGAVRGGVDVQVAGQSLWLDLHDDASRRTALRFLHRRLRPLAPDDLRATMQALLADLPQGAVPSGQSMSLDQLRTLAEHPLTAVGAHTRTHLQLAGQVAALQRAEIEGSVRDLEGLLGRPVTAFAYPFGTRRAVGGLAPKIAQEAGCTVACTTIEAPVTKRSRPHELPRLNVLDIDGRALVTAIRRVLALR